ncbi:MAG: alpha/beta hydrolase [Phenylobacterium sp.]|uniref:alpha/beta hydrolase n=1 Tax=Phenylobacterium sp. TaxID=1871053 RepID=UPI0025F287BE|nr:alpha/beta hydrolase [Phenylobacterium sp.]MBA4013793.1 alpha/beta hydrolase [Phenylobacterium sp.]
MSPKFPFRTLLCGLLALALTPLAALAAPPALDPTGAPRLSRFQARDGAALAYRAYPGGRRVAILLHGSAGQSLTMNPLAKSLNAAGASVYALDVRGHGASGPKGDIAYVGQLDDDLADFAAVVRREHPGADITLVGFSAGGAFALRTAGGADQDLFDRYMPLAPAIPFPSKIARRGGGWAQIDLARIVVIMGLNRLGLHGWDGAEVARFAVPPQVASLMTPAYSYRLAMNYGVRDHRSALRDADRPILVLAGSQDQQFHADRYAPEFQAANPKVRVQLVPGLDHVGLVTQPAGLAAITAAFLRP